MKKHQIENPLTPVIVYKPFILYILFILSIPCTLSAQWYDPEKVNKKAGEIYGSAYEDAQAGNYSAAITKLNNALQLDPKFVDVYLSRAGIYANLKDYRSSVNDFETGLRMDSVYANTYLLPYSISLAGMGSFDRALQVVDRFLQTPRLNVQSIKAGNYRKSTYEFALDVEKRIKEKEKRYRER